MANGKIDVTQLQLYKNLLPCIRKQDHAEFTRMLQMAADRYNWKDRHYWPFGRRPNLVQGFYWGGTPQGTKYWNELYLRLLRAGFHNAAG